MILLKNGHLYGPNNLGTQNILIGGNKILAHSEKLTIEGNQLPLMEINCTDKLIFPGFIDGHVHIAGGGGEGSFRTRTPEIQLSDITSAGVTTLVGCIGTDGTSRTMTNLLAKAYALEEEGITTYVYTGSYELPLRTLTNSIQDDIILVEKIIGVGEVAIADHRSSVPSVAELQKITAAARVGGMLSGKAGIVNIHLGDGTDELSLLYQAVESSSLPITQFIPTHMNRNPSLFKAAIAYGLRGGNIDFTTSTTDKFLSEGEVSCPKALKQALDAGVSIDQITFTSDGQGSLPDFDKAGNLVGLQIGKLTSLYDNVKTAIIDEKIPIEVALQVITSTPAKLLKLPSKGHIAPNMDADLVIVDKKTLAIETVIAKGQLMIQEGNILKRGAFEG